MAAAWRVSERTSHVAQRLAPVCQTPSSRLLPLVGPAIGAKPAVVKNAPGTVFPVDRLSCALTPTSRVGGGLLGDRRAEARVIGKRLADGALERVRARRRLRGFLRVRGRGAAGQQEPERESRESHVHVPRHVRFRL